MLKRIITSLFCLFLIFSSCPIFVFADTESSSLPSGYNPANTDYDLATSFNDYVKSRNANFNGTLPDAANIYILNLMNKGANNLNTNIDNIKNAIAKKSETGGRVIWYLDSTVTQFYNDLFDFLLQDLELEVGDTDVNKNIYSGTVFTDKDGVSTLVYMCSVLDASSSNNSILAYGTPYYMNFYQCINAYDSVNRSVTFTRQLSDNTSANIVISKSSGIYKCNFGSNTPKPIKGSGVNSGFPIICYRTDTNKYSTGLLQNNSDGSVYITRMKDIDMTNSDTQAQTNININFSSQQINNNNYEGDTYITNEGDVVNNNPGTDPDPITPGGNDPGWDIGGGQGSYEDNNGNSYIINFPDFELPDLNIDWSIQGLGNKFPFSIPFDIVSLVTVLNAEPEAPRFQGTVNFGFTTWDYDINLQQFDTVAQVCRIAELLLLVFGLILITRSIIKG